MNQHNESKYKSYVDNAKYDNDAEGGDRVDFADNTLVDLFREHLDVHAGSGEVPVYIQGGDDILIIMRRRG